MNIQDLNSWIEISESAYAANLEFFKKRISPNTELSVVIKSNAYGHGMLEIARLAIKHGTDSFCVHSLEEALLLRQAGIEKDILIMGPVLLSRLSDVVKSEFRLVFYNPETVRQLDRITKDLKKTVRLHIKLETGTYRQGVDLQNLDPILDAVGQNNYLQLEAAYTHFANIEDTTNHDFAFGQLKKFNEMCEFIKSKGYSELNKHTACSAAILLFQETHFDMVRLGISQYGLWPSKETLVSYKSKYSGNNNNVLQPVMTWKTRVGQIKRVPANKYIGYGCTYQTTRDSIIAILPVGYADGYDRQLSNQGYVLIGGKRAPVRGRICMNLIMVDITDIPDVKIEDEVVLLGRQGDEFISAEYLAGLSGTINYEFMTRINWQIPRIVK